MVVLSFKVIAFFGYFTQSGLTASGGLRSRTIRKQTGERNTSTERDRGWLRGRGLVGAG